MAYNQYLAERVRDILTIKLVDFTEKKMFGGLAFKVDDKMCVGIMRDEIMARVGAKFAEQAPETDGVKRESLDGMKMNDYLFIDDTAVEDDAQLDYWVQKCLDFNPRAKASKKRRKK